MPGGPKRAFHLRGKEKTHNDKQYETANGPCPTSFTFHLFLLILSLSNTLFACSAQCDKAVQHSMLKYVNTFLIAVDT